MQKHNSNLNFINHTWKFKFNMMLSKYRLYRFSAYKFTLQPTIQPHLNVCVALQCVFMFISHNLTITSRWHIKIIYCSYPNTIRLHRMKWSQYWCMLNVLSDDRLNSFNGAQNKRLCTKYIFRFREWAREWKWKRTNAPWAVSMHVYISAHNVILVIQIDGCLDLQWISISEYERVCMCECVCD